MKQYKHTFSTKCNDDTSIQTTITFDYDNASDNDILAWATSSRVISAQRWIKTLSAEDVKALDGTTIDATIAGRKPMTTGDALKAMLALRTSHPELFEKALAQMTDDDN